MARIAGVDLPREKRVEVGLTYIFGIGRPSAERILRKAGVDPDTRIHALSDADVNKLRQVIEKDYKVEGALRQEVNMNIKRLMDTAAIAACATVAACPSAGSARTRTRAPRRVRVALSRARRRLRRRSSR